MRLTASAAGLEGTLMQILHSFTSRNANADYYHWKRKRFIRLESFYLWFLQVTFGHISLSGRRADMNQSLQSLKSKHTFLHLFVSRSGNQIFPLVQRDKHMFKSVASGPFYAHKKRKSELHERSSACHESGQPEVQVVQFSSPRHS